MRRIGAYRAAFFGGIVIAAIACAGAFAPVYAQEAAVVGRVLDAATDEPLVGATVVLERGGAVLRGTTTDDNGAFEIARRGVDAGPARLEIRFVGFKTFERRVVIGPGDPVRIAATLDVEPVTLSALEIIGHSDAVFRKLSGTATRLSAREVDMIDPVGTQELLTYVPGVYGFADDGIGNSRISIGIRGLNPRRSSRVLVLEDGIPIQPAIYLYPNMYYNPPVERIDRVEVIKGSAAIRYGPQTMGGVVNYITSRPNAAGGFDGEVTTGTNGYLSLFTEMGGWGTQTLKPEVQLLFKRGDGFRQNNAFRQVNGTFKLSVLPDPQRVYYLKANVNYEHSNATYTGLTEYSFRNDPDFNPKDDDVFDVFRSSLDLIRSREYSSRFSATTRAYLSYFDRRWWHEFDVFERPGEFDVDEPSSIDPLPWYASGDLVRIGGGESNYAVLRTFYVGGVEHSYDYEHLLLGGTGSLHLGGRAHWERFVDDKKIGATPEDRDGVYYRGDPDDPETLEIVGQSHHYETTALALYAEEALDLGRLSVVPGVRLEVFEQERINRLDGSLYQDKTSHVILPGFGFNYGFGAVNLFGGIHRGYTPPSSGALKIVDFGQVADTGLDLRSEKSWNKELGLRGGLPWADFEAAAFHLSITDIVAAGRGTAFRNLGSARSYGLELAGTLRGGAIGAVLPDLHLAYTYLQTEVLDGRIESAQRAGAVVDISGNELPYAPRHAATVGLTKTFDTGLALRADVRFVDRVYSDFENIETTTNRGDTGPVPRHAVIDLTARYSVSRDLSIVLTGKNLLDEIYVGSRLHSNPGQPQAHLSSGIMPGPRRQINLALHYRY